MALDSIYLATAVEAALAAGRLHLQYFRQEAHVQKKGRIDLVTAADVAVETMFRRLIADRFPDHTVLGEELSGGVTASTSRFRWIIDPLDGTTNFAHGLQIFCVSIALEVDGRVELGVVYDPNSQELFTAERGEGARLNGHRMQVSSTATLVDALLCTGFPYSVGEDRGRHVRGFAMFLEQAQAVRRLGSAALDLCYVAAGRLDGYWEEKIHPWDIAAGGLIVAEAGGRVSTIAGQAFDPYAGEVVSSNGVLHDLMLETLAKARREPYSR